MFLHPTSETDRDTETERQKQREREGGRDREKSAWRKELEDWSHKTQVQILLF